MEASDTGVRLSDGSSIEAHIVSVATPVVAAAMDSGVWLSR